MKKTMYRFLLTGAVAAAMMAVTACGGKSEPAPTQAAGTQAAAGGETQAEAAADDIGFPKGETGPTWASATTARD